MKFSHISDIVTGLLRKNTVTHFELGLNIQALLLLHGIGRVKKPPWSKAQRIAALCGSVACLDCIHTDGMAAGELARED